MRPLLVNPALPFSAKLRQETAQLHARAEGSPFLAALVAGQVTRAGLAALLARLAPVYAALEDGRWQQDPVVAGFRWPELARGSRLAIDLEALDASPFPSPAVVAYVDHIAGGSRAAYLAHHYVRYLGDLSGGQIVRAALARSPGVDIHTGASFFAFPGLRVGTARERYRRLLDEAPLSEQERGELVRESGRAFALNIALVAELDIELDRWTVTPATPNASPSS